jgi:hypothetical protein
MALISLDNARAPEFSFRDMSYQMRGDTPLIHDELDDGAGVYQEQRVRLGNQWTVRSC